MKHADQGQGTLINREMSNEEFSLMKLGFDQNTLDNGVAIQSSDRISFVLLDKDKDKFIGCSSGLAYKNGVALSGWFYLTDLYVQKEYRKMGYGAKLLRALEFKAGQLGVQHFWTWTAGYEAPGFYKKQGYEVFASFENWYSDGSSRIGLRKQLSQ